MKLSPSPAPASASRSPWAWIPTLYLFEGLPNITVTYVALIMFSDMGWNNTDASLFASLLGLPWMFKFVWCPLLETVRDKCRMILLCQLLMSIVVAVVAMVVPLSDGLRWSFAMFLLLAFSSATHDIVADGYYIDVLTTHQQALFVGIRSTFYRIATIVGKSGLVWLVGLFEMLGGDKAHSWSMMFYILAALSILMLMAHCFTLPQTKACEVDEQGVNDVCAQCNKPVPSGRWRAVVMSWKTFFSRPDAFGGGKQVLAGLAFMLLYRLPEGLLNNICPLFMMDSAENGGLGMDKFDVGMVQGVWGAIGLTVGGILGGVLIARHGIRRWLWPMVMAITLPDVIYVVLSFNTAVSPLVVGAAVFIEQFGYGFGFTAYMMYLIYYSQGRYSTAHYAICTSIMAWSLYPVGMIAGWLQTMLGYQGFFVLVMLCCTITFAVTACLKIDPKFGCKQ